LLLKLHLDGLSFRTLASQFDISVGSAYNYVYSELEKLPHCADVTRHCCQKFCGILQVDGKFLSVKPYKRQIPVIYGVDYQTHDIPHFILSKAENYQTLHKFFSSLYLTGYNLLACVSDDNKNIHQAAVNIYPAASVQLCHIHYLRNIKLALNLQENPQYKDFFNSLKTLFITKRSRTDFDRRARGILKYYLPDKVCASVMIDIEKRKDLLLGYHERRKIPVTTNLIEGLNSHLDARVTSLKGFESFQHAKLWLNAYFLRRRTKKFTDCRGKFKRLNGKTSLEITKRPGATIPKYF
jgi:transposase-like protein